ncbi:GATA zinc finger domain-containing protein 4-like [Apis dorsata]|uniref:GATA zinc finger domain-containing protein 4-like n=1 Tax=Apis dorsata TaxID=7462 RepID=UPI00129333BB|nr:GATA zinc finger domain-containing protein 4-like [Apis dorsata]
MDDEYSIKREIKDNFHSKNCESSSSFMIEDEVLNAIENHEDLENMTFYMANYIKDAMKMMFIMRSHHMFTDVILEIESELFHAHKIILAAASPYFKTIFTGDLKTSQISKIKLQGVNSATMACLIYFMYTGKIRITEITVYSLLSAATMFQISNVIDACCVFLKKQLHPTTNIEFTNFAEQYNYLNICQKVNVKEEVSQQSAENVKEKTKNNSKLQETDLLNLEIPNNNSINNIANSELNNFSHQKENNLLGEFNNFFQQETKNTVPVITDPIQNNLIFYDQPITRNDDGNNNLNDLYLNENQTTKQNLEDLFDPLGKKTVNNLLGNVQNTKSNKKSSFEKNFPRNSNIQNKNLFVNLVNSLGTTELTSIWNGTTKNNNIPSATSASASIPIHSNSNIHRINDITVSDSKTNKSNGDVFKDLLNSQGYNFFNSRKTEKDNPKTINQMRKIEAAKIIDPDRLKIVEWTEGKKGNLRALLSSLHMVLWSEDNRWQRCEMHQLVTTADVKKAYRKACLAVHPDKQAGTANENIAKLIFMELNNAWNIFKNDALQQNLF